MVNDVKKVLLLQGPLAAAIATAMAGETEPHVVKIRARYEPEGPYVPASLKQPRVKDWEQRERPKRRRAK